MADKLITDFPLRSNVSSDVNFVGDDGIQTYRVTAAQIKDYILPDSGLAFLKMQNIAQGSILGRTSSGSGVIQEITVGQGLAFSGGGLSVNAGGIIQRVYTQFPNVATGSTTIPHDDSIPQNTEGTEFMTQAITPTSATNKLIIEVTMSLSNSLGDFLAVAVFQDSVANAITAMQSYHGGGQDCVVVGFKYEMVAGTTSPTTFKVRAGPSTTGTLTFNGRNGARRFGGIMASSISVTEYKV